MARTVDVRNRISVDDRSRRPLGQIEARFAKLARVADKVGRSTRNMGRSLAPLSAAAGLAGFKIFDTAVSFERSMNKVKAISGAAGDNLESLRDLAKDLGSTTAFSASQAAGGMAFLAQAGWDTQQILAGIPDALSLAAASGVEIEMAADAMSNIMGAFGIEAERAGRVADILAHTTSTANVDMTMLAETMKGAAPIAATFGATLEDTAAMAGLLGNIGIQGSDSGTALKRSFLAMAAPASKGGKVLARLGVVTKDALGNMRPAADIMADLGGALGKLGTGNQLAAVDAIFGKIGMAGAIEISKQATSGRLAEVVSGYDAITGRSRQMADTMMEGAPGAVANLTSALEGLQIAIGESGMLEAITEMITGITGWVRELSAASPATLKWITIIGGIVAVAAPVLVSLGFLMQGFGGLVTGGLLLARGLAVVATGMKILTVAMMANPVGLLVVALAAAAGAVYFYWGPIKEWFGEFFDWLGSGFEGVLGWIKDTFGWVGDLLGILGKMPGPLGVAVRAGEAVAGMLGGDTAASAPSIVGEAARAGAIGNGAVREQSKIDLNLRLSGETDRVQASMRSDGPVKPTLDTGTAMVMP